MCFQLDSEPPITPVLGASVRGEELVLTSLDGTRFAAFAGHVESVTPARAGIVILPDVRGLYRFYRDLALRFAEQGISSVAIDYFGRSAGLTPRDDDFDFMPHVMQTTPEGVTQDVASAIAYLRQQPGGEKMPIFTVGFCFGGGNSFQQAANNQGLAGVIGFYGQVTTNRFGGQPVIERVGQFSCPVLGLFGGADQAIPVEGVRQFDAALGEHHVEHEVVIYDGAPHSFFDRKYEEFAKESEDAWQRILAFIQKYSA